MGLSRLNRTLLGFSLIIGLLGVGIMLEAQTAGLNNSISFDKNGNQITTHIDMGINSPDLFQLEAWSGGPVPLGATQ